MGAGVMQSVSDCLQAGRQDGSEFEYGCMEYVRKILAYSHGQQKMPIPHEKFPYILK
jgi:hypothetical protein